MSLRHLRNAAHVELISLTILLANLATAHLKRISSLISPAHGCAYLFVVAATWNLKQAATTTKATALIPGASMSLSAVSTPSRRLDTMGSPSLPRSTQPSQALTAAVSVAAMPASLPGRSSRRTR